MRLWSPHGAPASLDRRHCLARPAQPARPDRHRQPQPASGAATARDFPPSAFWLLHFRQLAAGGAQAGNLDRAVKGPACIGQNLKPWSIHLESKLCAQAQVITLAGLGDFSACFTEPPPLCSTRRRVISNTLIEGTHFAGGCTRGLSGGAGFGAILAN
jgi:hypothetical protein